MKLKSKILVPILAIIIVGAVYAILQEEKTGNFFANRLGADCLGVVMSVRNKITGECKDFPSGCFPPWYKFDTVCMEEMNKRIEAKLPKLKTYHNDRYSFEVQYWSNFEIKVEDGYKMSEFSICDKQNCKKFLYVDVAPLQLTGPYLNWRKLDPPDPGTFYYYFTDIKETSVKDVQNTIKFLK